MTNFNNDNILNELQFINNNLSSVIKNHGIYNLEYLIDICLGNDFIEKSKLPDRLLEKYDIKAYFTGCLTLFFDETTEKNNSKYAVDVNSNLEEYKNFKKINSEKCFII